MGHLMPGLAVGAELTTRGIAQEQIHFVGSSRGVEAKVVPAAGFSLTLLPGRGIQRRIAVANIAAIAGLVLGIFKAIFLVRKLRPRVLLSTGGYASVACVVAAKLWGVPVVVAESNAVAGAANRFAGRTAKACAVAFSEAALPNQVVTGNPLRDEILATAKLSGSSRKNASRARLNLSGDVPLLLVFGGSLGARRINRAVFDLAKARPELNIYHVIGHRDWAMFSSDVDSLGENHTAVEYEEHMEDALAAADLVLCRSGATTVAELSAIGVASILVPLPIATQDHQTANAKSLSNVGAAVLIADSELNATSLIDCVDDLIGDEALLAEMAANARSTALLDAASRVADLLEEHASND